jgi:hypothetical protein
MAWLAREKMVEGTGSDEIAMERADDRRAALRRRVPRA